MSRFLQAFRAPQVRRASLLLLGGLAGLCLRGQAPLPAGPLTPDTLSRFCAAQRAPECVVPLSGQYTLALNGNWVLPRSVHLRFAEEGALHISGGTLDFGGGSVEAPASDAIFPDPDRVRGLAAARPEWFGTTATEPVAASALAAAYQATEPWGTIYLQARAYISPLSGCATLPESLRYLSARTLVGAGRPTPDSLTEPSRLQGGTVLLGGIVGTAPLRLAHLGIDAGPQVSAQILRGCRPPGVFIEQPSTHEFVSGDRLEDVSVLTTGAPDMHSVMIAGHQEAQIRDLWIWTLGGIHGLVLKSSNSLVDGLHCSGASGDCLIVKSDYATDMLGRAVHDRVAHVDIHPLQPGGAVGGILVDSSWDTVRALDMEDLSETGTPFGISLSASFLHHAQDIRIRNWTADGVFGACLLAYRATDLQVAHFRCGLKPSAPLGALLLSGRDTHLQDGSFTCEGGALQCSAGTTDGILDDAAATALRNVVVNGLGGHALRGRDPLASPADLQPIGMGSRGFILLANPWRLRMQADMAHVKPALRILYTAALTRILLHLRLSSCGGVLLFSAAVWLLARRARQLRMP